MTEDLSIRNLSDAIKRLEGETFEYFKSTLERPTPQRIPEIGAIDLDKSKIFALQAEFDIIRRVVIRDGTPLLEFNVVFEDLLTDEKSVIYQFYLIPISDDATDLAVARSYDGDPGLCGMHNTTERKILTDFSKALIQSKAFTPLKAPPAKKATVRPGVI